jgi:flagellar basal body-associated protein FliL
MANLNDQDDYTAGKRDEQLRQQEDSGVQGLLIGVLLVLGACGIAAAFFFSNRSQAPVTPVVVPTTAPASPASPPVSEKRETIIREKSTEVVPVPVSPAAAPNVNITIPSSQPSQSSAQPSQNPTQPSSGASSSPAPSTSPSATESAPATSNP